VRGDTEKGDTDCARVVVVGIDAWTFGDVLDIDVERESDELCCDALVKFGKSTKVFNTAYLHQIK
jgi:hypothetical protein